MRVEGLGFRVLGFWGFRVWGLGFVGLYKVCKRVKRVHKQGLIRAYEAKSHAKPEI